MTYVLHSRMTADELISYTEGLDNWELDGTNLTYDIYYDVWHKLIDRKIPAGMYRQDSELWIGEDEESDFCFKQAMDEAYEELCEMPEDEIMHIHQEAR